MNLPIARTRSWPQLCHPLLILTALNFHFKYLRYNQQLPTPKKAQKLRFLSNIYQIKNVCLKCAVSPCTCTGSSRFSDNVTEIQQTVDNVKNGPKIQYFIRFLSIHSSLTHMRCVTLYVYFRTTYSLFLSSVPPWISSESVSN